MYIECIFYTSSNCRLQSFVFTRQIRTKVLPLSLLQIRGCSVIKDPKYGVLVLCHYVNTTLRLVKLEFRISNDKFISMLPIDSSGVTLRSYKYGLQWNDKTNK